MRSTAPLFVALTVVLAGCGPTSSPVIDTWPIGEERSCASLPACEELTRVGLMGLAERDPGHPPIVNVRLHDEGAVFDPATGNQILMTRSGACCHVLVVDHADGTTSAIGVGFPGVSREAIAIPWEIIPGE